MTLASAALDYNQKRIELFQEMRQKEEQEYPILHLEIDDILNGSFSESRLEEMQEMLTKAEEEEAKRKSTLLKCECIAGVATMALCFAAERYSPTAFQCLLRAIEQNRSR